MNEKKQIEEMANDYYEAMLKAGETLGSMNEGAPKWYAKELYAKGYRKASEVAREICAEIGERFKSLLGTLPANGAFTDAKTFIEAHWEFIEHSIVFAYDAELKKKYTEGGE